MLLNKSTVKKESKKWESETEGNEHLPSEQEQAALSLPPSTLLSLRLL
jgi:hypothetical protein